MRIRFTGNERYKLAMKFNFKCQICNKKLKANPTQMLLAGEKRSSYEKREVLQVDHIIPLSKEGENGEENLQILCSECNGRKSNKILEVNNNNGSS